MNIMDHVEDYAKDLEGNWQKFQSFGWSSEDRPDDSDKWCIVYTHNRDSGTVERSNAQVIAETMAPFLGWHKDGADAQAEHHGHWAVGWVDGYAIRVRDTQGNPTPAFVAWCEMQMAIENYSVLDSGRHSEMEYEESAAYWAQMSTRERVDVWKRCCYPAHFPAPREDFHMMACRRNELPRSNRGALEEYLRGN
jgi:hypothetical protein